MPGIRAFSHWEFEKGDVHNPQVEMLLDETNRHEGPLLLRDVLNGQMAWTHRERVSFLVKHMMLEPEQLVFGTGLFDALSDGQIVVDEMTSAAKVTRLLEAIDGALAVVVRGVEPVGIFVPSAMADRLPHASVLAERPNGMAVATLASEGHIAEALMVAEASFSDFHNEDTNYGTINPPLCRAAGGHYVGSCPCRSHPEANCDRD